MKKLISVILSVVLLFSILAVEASAALPPINNVDPGGNKLSTIDYKATVLQYLSDKNLFATDEAKLANMTFMYEKDGYQLYADEFTGEVATKNLATGQILFTNPSDIASSTAAHSDNTKYELMSQLVVKYVDKGSVKHFYSFEQAAMNGQITVKNIKDGLRVEYTIGREDTKFLVPRLMEKERFDTLIRQIVLAGVVEKYGCSEEEAMGKIDYRKIMAYYDVLKDPNNVASDRELAEMQASFPITKKSYKGQLMAVRVCSATTSSELREVENIIKTYCPLYTYEQLEYDHTLTEYSKSDRAPALFKMALEYRLDETGLSVRLPANGIRFNEAEYQLNDITILPWMGCGSNENTGYTFFPDGSGAIFRFEDLNDGLTHQLNASIYGHDFAYHTLVNMQNRETIRYPVFGLVENEAKPKAEAAESDDKTNDRGYVAIIEEGEALAKLNLIHYGAQSKYNSIQVLVNPRPKDTYVLSDAISVGSNNSVTVISKRKYVGDYKIRYMMLTDKEIAAENGLDEYYEATWVGMAKAYRDYLSSPYSTGTQKLPEDQQSTVLDRLTAEEVKEDIPLYIETFGAMETIEKRLSIPVEVMVAMTSFENIQQMYEDLSGKGIKNVNFKLTGYYNGGMYSAVPYRLDFEKAVGGKEGFKELIADAKSNGYGVYLDFDFAYASMAATKMFDGLSNRRDLVKSIDDRYTSKQYYSATRQSYTSYFELAISPSRFRYFYDKVSAEYLEYNPVGISLSTLGNSLNSDFDEDEPYNREDSKQFTKDLFDQISKDYGSVMADSANAYTWKYIDHMINAAVDSSRYMKASASVPFLGVVLHGSIQMAGTPMNMDGNIGYSMLKAIENGSGLYFILSYANTEILKEDHQLSEYYSVRYDIWFDELVERYTNVNNVLKDLQTNLIIDHEFLIGERVPDEDEVIADKEAEEKAEAEKKAEEELKAHIEYINTIRKGRYEAYESIISTYESMLATVAALEADMVTFTEAYNTIIKEDYLGQIPKAEEALAAANKAYDDYMKAIVGTPTTAQREEIRKLLEERTAATNALNNLKNGPVMGALKQSHVKVGSAINNFKKYVKTVTDSMELMNFAYTELSKGDYDIKVVNDIKEKYDASVSSRDYILSYVESFEANYKANYYENMLKLDPDHDYYKVEEEKPVEPPKEEDKDEYKYTKYTNDNGNIVAVTYGGKNGNDDEAFRTFILNYNYFDITVVYNETTHTIPAFGYIVIEH